MRKKIVIFCASLGNGGAERAMFNLICGLVERGFDVHLLVADSAGHLIAQLPKQVTLVDLNAKRALFCIPGIVRHLRMEQPDVLLSALDYVNIIAVIARFISGISLRLVATVHAQPKFFLGKLNSLRSLILLRLFKVAHNKADKIVVVSKGLADELIDVLGIKKGKVCVIYNPIVNKALLDNINKFSGVTRVRNPQTILAVGRLAVEKDFPTLIRAFNLVRARCAVRLQILGEGDQLDDLKLLVKSLNLDADVEFLGYQPDPYAYMKRSSCFVLCSTSEGFGNVLVEALAAGCPIVATNCPYGPSEILDSGKWGTLVPIGDFHIMADEIFRTLNNVCKVDDTMLQSHLKSFDVSSVTEKYTDVFFDIP